VAAAAVARSLGGCSGGNLQRRALSKTNSINGVAETGVEPVDRFKKSEMFPAGPRVERKIHTAKNS